MADPLNLKEIEDITFSSGCGVKSAVAVRMVNLIITGAIKSRTSHIHIDP